MKIKSKTLVTRYYFYAVCGSVKEKKMVKTSRELKLLLSWEKKTINLFCHLIKSRYFKSKATFKIRRFFNSVCVRDFNKILCLEIYDRIF